MINQKLLESTLGIGLFRRVGRRLKRTETGELALSYAEENFRAGGELEERLRSSPSGRPVSGGSGRHTVEIPWLPGS